MPTHTFESIIRIYEEALQSKNPLQHRARVISATRWLSFLSPQFLNDGVYFESRKRIQRVLNLAERSSKVSGIVTETQRWIWTIRQKAEVFE